MCTAIRCMHLHSISDSVVYITKWIRSLNDALVIGFCGKLTCNTFVCWFNEWTAFAPFQIKHNLYFFPSLVDVFSTHAQIFSHKMLHNFHRNGKSNVTHVAISIFSHFPRAKPLFRLPSEFPLTLKQHSIFFRFARRLHVKFTIFEIVNW